MLEYVMVPEEGEQVLAVRRAVEGLGWRTGWDMQQDMVFGWVEWLLVADREGGQRVENRKRVTHAELRNAEEPGEYCRNVVAEAWEQILGEVRLLTS